jgi:uncharacterized damage-inducible protein DinB
MSVDLIRGLYDYHRWANRVLYDVALALGEEVASRDVGTQFSYPTIRQMFGHLYGADKVWLARWAGGAPPTDPPRQFPTLASIRAPWDALEREQRAFVESASAAELAQVIHFIDAQGVRRGAPLGPLLQHVVNHATHHRSEIATMLTMVSGSPPDTGLGTYLRDVKNR